MTLLTGVQVGHATMAELPAIVRIYNQSVPERNATCDVAPTTLEVRLPWFYSHTSDYPLWTARLCERTVGWACLSPFDHKAGYATSVENSVYVDVKYRHRGIGSTLLRHTVQEADRLGYHATIAKVFAHNPVSLALHARFGFVQEAYLKEVARMDGIYLDVVYLVRRHGTTIPSPSDEEHHAR